MRRLSISFICSLVAACVVLVGVGVHAQAAKDPKAMKNPVAPSPQSITAGAAAYKKYCSFCHGAAGKGDGPLAPKDSAPADLTDAKWDHGSTDGEIFTIIQNGVPSSKVMVGLKGKMPDQDMWHVVNYLRSIGPKSPAR